ncbi:MAG: cobalt transporter CbiM [Nitrospiraceae bacterium]|nr:cobalt transporter CbiM [Nitrospiraceae bacterium]
MHIPDGYLGPETYGSFWAATLALWYLAGRKLKKTLKATDAPLLALGAAASFVVMMFNVPIVGGTTGHATGATLLAVVLGPWAAFICMSIALAVQALLFGDGGITTYGANCFNMAFAGVFAGWAVYRLLAGSCASASKKRLLFAAGSGAYFGINVAAFLTAIELGIQPILERGADGKPLYNPFPLKITIPAIMAGHLTLFGFAEAAFTVLSIAYIIKSHPELICGTIAGNRAGEKQQ